jgi:hypothetical protein
MLNLDNCWDDWKMIWLGSILQYIRQSGLRNRCHSASILGKGDPISGQIAASLNHPLHLKSRHSRVYAIG